MFEDPSSQISKVSNLKFLIPIVLHTSKDKHYYISLLYRIDNPGIHHIICQRLKDQTVFNLTEEIPQLIEILLKNDKISHPVYCLLKENTRKDIAFRIALFLRLKSVLGTAEESKAEICYYLCCDILQIDEYRNRLNIKRYHRNVLLNKNNTRVLTADDSSVVADNSIAADDSSVVADNSIPIDDSSVVADNSIAIDDSSVVVENCVADNSIAIDETHSNNTHIHRINVTNMKYLRHYYKTFYYRLCSFKRRPKLPLIQGLMLYFSKSILSVFNTPFFTYLDSYSKIFNSKKTFKNLQFKSFSTPFKRNSQFLEHLVKISVSLKIGIPPLRHRILKIYLEILNREMDGNIFDPLDPSKRIIKFSLDHAKVLDSAENCPFIAVFETIDAKGSSGNKRDVSGRNGSADQSGIRKAKALLKQLEVLGDLDDVGAINGIKESLVVAIENVLGRSFYETTIDISDDIIRPLEHNNSSVETIQSIESNGSEETNKQSDSQSYSQLDNQLDKQSDSQSDSQLETTGNLGEESNNVKNKQVNLEILTTNQKYDELTNTDNKSSVAVNEIILPNPVVNESLEDKEVASEIFSDNKSLASIKNKLRITSRYSSLPGWSISSFIVKSGNVLKHEYLAYQVLSQMKDIFLMENLPIYIKNYRIILISDTAGLVETVDAQSIHRLKFDMKFKTLESYFQTIFSGEDFENAKRNFLYSLVGYSLACFILQIKDRHNGNILIDRQGHIIHVDFGFTFGKHPGIISVENAPFKFSSEYLSLVDMTKFKDLFVKGFKVLRKHREKLSRLVEIMKDSGYLEPFEFDEFVNRLRVFDSEKELEGFCQGLIDKSIRNMRTVFYDQFQYLSNGYL